MRETELTTTRRQALLAIVILIATFAYVALHISTPEVEILGRYSRRFFVVLLVYLAFTLAAGLLVIHPAFPLQQILNRLRRAPRFVIAACIASGVVLWALVPGEPAAKLYPSVVLLLLLWLMLEDVPPDVQNWGGRRIVRVFVALLAGGLVLEFVFLLYLPTLYGYDEGAYAHVAMRYLQTGRLPGDFLGFPPRHFIGFGSWLAVLGYWFDVLGFGWWTGRLYAFAASALALAAIYLAGKTLYGRNAGIGAAAFMGVSSTFVATHAVRPDAPMLLMVGAGLAAYALAWRQPRPRHYFLHGFLATLTLEAHLMGLAFWGTYAGLYGLTWLHRCWSLRRLVLPTGLLWFIAGSLIPGVVFFVTHLLPDWGLPNAIILSNRTFSLVGSIRKEIVRWVEYFATYPLEGMLVLWAVIYALRRRRPEDRQMLGLLGLLVLAYAVVAPTDWPQYTRYFLPVTALLFGGMLSGELVLKPALAIAAIGLLSGALVGEARKVLPNTLGDGLTRLPTPPIVTYVTDNLAPGSTVVMDPAYYLYLEDGHRYHYVQPGVHPPTINRLGGPPEGQVWATLDPDIVVLDVMKNEHTQWLDNYLATGQFVYLDTFEDAGFEIYVPPDSPLAIQP